MLSPDKAACSKEANKQHSALTRTSKTLSSSTPTGSMSPTHTFRHSYHHHPYSEGRPEGRSSFSHLRPTFSDPYDLPSFSVTLKDGNQRGGTYHESIDDFDVQHIVGKPQDRVGSPPTCHLTRGRALQSSESCGLMQPHEVAAASKLHEEFAEHILKHSSTFQADKTVEEDFTKFKVQRWEDFEEDEDELEDYLKPIVKWGDIDSDEEELQDSKLHSKWGDEDSEDDEEEDTKPHAKWGDEDEEEEEMWGTNVQEDKIENERALEVVRTSPHMGNSPRKIHTSPSPVHSDIRIFLTNASSSPPQTAPFEVMRGEALQKVKFRVKGKAAAGYLALNSKRVVFGDQDIEDEVPDVLERAHKSVHKAFASSFVGSKTSIPTEGLNGTDSALPTTAPPMHLLMKLSDMDYFNIQQFQNIDPSAKDGSACTDLVRSFNRPMSHSTCRERKNSLSLSAKTVKNFKVDLNDQLCYYLEGNVPPLENLDDVMAGSVVHLVVQRSTLISATYLSDGLVEVTLTSGTEAPGGVSTHSSFGGRLCPPPPKLHLGAAPEELITPMGSPTKPNSLVTRTHSMKNMLFVEEVGLKEAHEGGIPTEGAWSSSMLPSSSACTTHNNISSQKVLSRSFLQASEGLKNGQDPDLAPSGTGGTYFMRNPKGVISAVFKPEDEEPRAKNNPRGFTPTGSGEGLRKGTVAGEGAVREVAVYLIDHDHFAKVPPTCLANLSGDHVKKEGETEDMLAAKRGSLQKFVECLGDLEENGHDSIHFEEIHKIAILDMRTGNCDRNGGNMLKRRRGEHESRERGEFELIPIDHAYTFPHSLQDLSFEWHFWTQAMVPFSAASLEYIKKMDYALDLKLLSASGINLPSECSQIFAICTMMLQKGAAAGLTPNDIATIMSRRIFNQMSDLEKMFNLAFKSSKRNRGSGCSQEETFIQEISLLMDQYLEALLSVPARSL